MNNNPWKNITNNSWKDDSNDNISHGLEFSIDLDNYNIESLVPGLRKYINNELSNMKFTILLVKKITKQYFLYWKYYL